MATSPCIHHLCHAPGIDYAEHHSQKLNYISGDAAASVRAADHPWACDPLGPEYDPDITHSHKQYAPPGGQLKSA